MCFISSSNVLIFSILSLQICATFLIFVLYFLSIGTLSYITAKSFMLLTQVIESHRSSLENCCNVFSTSRNDTIIDPAVATCPFLPALSTPTSAYLCTSLLPSSLFSIAACSTYVINFLTYCTSLNYYFNICICVYIFLILSISLSLSVHVSGCLASTSPASILLCFP